MLNHVYGNYYGGYSVSKVIEPKYEYEGEKNKTDFPEFIKICRLEQKKLKTYLRRRLRKYYKSIVCEDGFLYARGTTPVLLTAHMDTVHVETVKDFYELKTEDKNGKVKHKISSPQGIGGDDRCGVWMIFQILQHTDFRPSILFCEDEEIGTVGAGKFADTDYVLELSDLKFLIELDRMNEDDAVFYECDNPEFTNFILDTTKYIEQPGSYSDICVLSPECGIASVNFSCGYYCAHTTREYVIVEEMMNTVEAVKKLLEESEKESTPKFEYIRKTYNKYGRYGAYGSWDDWDYNYSAYGLNKLENKSTEGNQVPNKFSDSSQDTEVEMCFEYYDKDHVVQWEIYGGINEYECIGQFMIAHPDLSLMEVDCSYL